MFRRRKTSITARELGDYGNPIAGDINVEAAAQNMGVSRSTIKDALSRARTSMTNTVMRAISGREAADTSRSASPLGKLQAAFGRGPRGGSVNAAAAASELGVSETTIRRWAKGSQKPSTDHEETLDKAARRSTSTKAGRRALTADFRNSATGKAATRKGGTVRISGYQGPKGNTQKPKDDYCRDRNTALTDLTPQNIEDMLRAYEERGDKGLHEWMGQAAAEKLANGKPRYHSDWDYITIERFEIEGYQ